MDQMGFIPVATVRSHRLAAANLRDANLPGHPSSWETSCCLLSPGEVLNEIWRWNIHGMYIYNIAIYIYMPYIIYIFIATLKLEQQNLAKSWYINFFQHLFGCPSYLFPPAWLKRCDHRYHGISYWGIRTIRNKGEIHQRYGQVDGIHSTLWSFVT
jgi:hypothetical protein